MAVVIDELGITNLDDQAEPNIIRTKISESTPKLETKHNNLQETSGPSVQVDSAGDISSSAWQTAAAFLCLEY